LGVLLLFRAISIWSAADFGAVNADGFTRIVIGSSLLISLGLELAFSCCLLSMIQLNIRILPGAREKGQ
jgi:hypothetical protein